LKELEEKTGQSKVYFFVGGVLLLFGLIYGIGGFELFANLIGFVYPAYMSLKALEGGKNVDGNATQWMTYWILFCSLTLIESTFPFVTEHFKWYYLVKIVTVIYLYHPKTNGAEMLYTSAIRPYVVPLINGSTTPSAKPVEGEKEAEAKKDE
jgi:receptor expression-enhancing protein 5/6